MKSHFITELLTSKVVTIPPETYLSEAVSIMRNKNISCILVTKNHKPEGIFTERDMVKLLCKNPQSENLRMQDLMTKNLVTVKDDINIYDLYNILIDNNIRHLVVVDQEEALLGVITQTDIINTLGLEYFLEVKEVSKIMTRSLFILSGEALVTEAIANMADKALSCVLVAKDNKPLGIFTERDVVDLYNKKTELNNLKIKEVMHVPVITVNQGTPLHIAVNLMYTKKIRRIIVVDSDGAVVGLITQFDIVKGLEAKYIQFLKDIINTKENIIKETEKDLFEKSTYLENILYSSKDMSIIATDMDYRILYCNPISEKIFGYKTAELTSITLESILRKEKIDDIRIKHALRIIRDHGGYDFMIEQKKEDETYYIESKLSGIWDKNTDLMGYVFISRDITERKRAEQRMEFMAHYDLLTGIPNRTLFFDRVMVICQQAKRENYLVGLFFIDLDNFKSINDNLGHHIGDMVLKTTANKLSECIRKCDTVARISGDEFAIILSRINSKDDVIIVARKIIDLFSHPTNLEGNEINTTVSIGITIQSPHQELSEKDLLKNADTAMYFAKAQGKNNYKFFEDIKPVK